MKICTHYVSRKHQVAVQRKVLKWKSSRIWKLMETSTVQCHRSHRCHCVTHYRSSWPSWTDQWLIFYYAQHQALGHIVEGMRLCFQLRCQIRCLVNVFEAWSREAMLLPPSSVIAHYHCMIAYSSETKLIAGLFERQACETPKSRPFIFARFPQECMCLAVGKDRLKFVKCYSIQQLLTRYVLLVKPICFTAKTIVINNTIWLSLFAYKRKKTNQAPNANKLAFHVLWSCIIIMENIEECALSLHDCL